jgi:2-phosphoglycerate kinase
LKHSLPLITDRKEVLPFSQGILARSLVRCGIAPSSAYKVATEIQKSLGPGSRYSKKVIMRKVSAYLRKEFGRGAAEKYEKSCIAVKSILPSGDILIVGKGTKAPFSKGILVKSIRAGGIDVNTSHSIARSIEENLRANRCTQITGNQLCAATHNQIESVCGRKAAQRYLLWREVATAQVPLVILIGGATGVGKSTISVELASRLEITQVVSTDVIREMMRTMFSSALLPLVHKSSYQAWEELHFPPNRAIDPVVTAFHEQSLLVNVGTVSMIKRAIDENVDAIINGVHIVPGTINLTEFPGVYLAQLLLIVRDEETHRMRFLRRQRGVPARPAKRYLKNFAIIRKIQEYLIDCAKRTKTPIVENIDFERTCDAVLGYLASIISKCRGGT